MTPRVALIREEKSSVWRYRDITCYIILLVIPSIIMYRVVEIERLSYNQ